MTVNDLKPAKPVANDPIDTLSRKRADPLRLVLSIMQADEW
jgi:hypothetical protein